MTTANRRALLAAVLTALTLAGCSGNAYPYAQAPEPDPAVAAMLPTGSYNVSGRLTLGKFPDNTIEGFVDFGTTPDGTECESDSTLTRGYEEDGFKYSWREISTAGGQTWIQVREENSSTTGEWLDSDDPLGTTLPFLLFVPALVTSEGGPGMFEGAGTGNLCSIGTMARFMSVEGDHLVFDYPRAKAVSAARHGQWVEKFIDALGLRGKDASELADTLLEDPWGGYGALFNDSLITIERSSNGSFNITQLRKGIPLVELKFTPTADREVEVVQALTYFERVTAKAKKDGVESVVSHTLPMHEVEEFGD